MVDARLTPLAAMGLDHGTLMREGLRLHGGVVYPGIRALSAEKSREGAALPLGYSRDGLPELLYKPDMTMDGRKPANGYMGLYKGPPPGFHKPMLLPGAESLGLERRLAPGEKPSELGLVGAGGYLRLPWLSPYPDAGMYPFVDSSKYAALSMYKASLFSQPNPYLPQHLAYQSLCAAQGGNAAAAERLYYMPHYPPSPISSPLVAPPMRIPTVTVAPTTLVHCQDKGLSVGPRVHHDGSPFGQQLHQLSPHPPHLQCHTDRERPPSRSSKPSRAPSSKGPGNGSNSNTTGGSSNSSLPIDSSPRASSRLPQPPPPPPALVDSSPDGQRPHPRSGPAATSSTCSSASSFSTSSTSSQSAPHPFYASNVAPEHPSPARPSPHKPRSRDGATEPRAAGGDRRASRSPSRSSSERPAHQLPGTKDPTEKPLDLSGRLLELGLSPNGFPAKLEALPPGARYGLPPSRELLKETLSLSSKGPERPEMISTLHSSWVVPTPVAGHAHPSGRPPSPRPSPDLAPPREKSSPSVIKHKALERVLPQHHSSPAPRAGEANPVPLSGHNAGCSGLASRPHSPKPNGDWPKHSPGRSEPSPVLVHLREVADKAPKAPKRAAAAPEASPYKRPCVENGHPPSHLYLPQSEAYLNHSLAYASRYLPYAVPDSMALHSLPMAGKGPVYPHPVLLGSNSLYPAHLAPKHPMPYHGGEYLTYNAQEMAHPLMHPHPDAKPHERGDAGPKPRSQDGGAARGRSGGLEMRPGGQGKPEREAGELAGSQSQPTPSSSAASSERIVCIDLVISDTDGKATPAASKQAALFPDARINQNECRHGNQSQTKTTEPEPKHSPHYRQHPPPSYPPRHVQSPAQRPSQTDRQPEVLCRRPRGAQDTGRSSPPPSSPGRASQQDGSPEEQSPPSDLGDNDQSTLRCARTSGEWKEDRGRRAHPLPGKEAEGLRERREDRLVDPEESFEEEEEDGEEEDGEGGHGSRGLRRSSLAKRIANSSGFVGDRIKCVTTELYADSSKLSREQRALQMEVRSREESNISQPAANWERAMMRFSELELKEKEGGGGVCVSASAAGRGLAGGQHRARELERFQHTARLGEREGARPLYGSNRVPVLQRCGGQREAAAPRGGSGDGASRRDAGLAAEGRCTPPTLSPAEGCLQDRAQKCPYEPQAGEQGEAGEPGSHGDKRAAGLCADESSEPLRADQEEEDEEVGKLKVCIELTGLRLSKPAAASPDRPLVKQERAWPPTLTPGHLPTREWRARADEPEEKALSQHGEVTRKWCGEALVNGAPAAPLTPSQLKDRAPPTMGPFSGDRGSKEARRVGGGAGAQCPPSPVPEPPAGDTPPLKPRRHGDPDKPKGKRPCKTKHTGQKERERRRELAPASAALCSPQEDKVIDQRCAQQAKGAASPNRHAESPVKPCSPAPARAASQPPQANGTGGAPQEGASPPVESPAARPIPPEARRLIVNKNAGETLLQRAARLGYEEVVLYCLENRVCEVNHRDYAGYCALHEACARGWLSIVQHLLEHGADINCSAQDGTRPLHDAVENDHVDVVRLLLSYGADPTLSTYSGRDLLKMTHSDIMKRFLSDYFADLQGRLDDDPGLCWEFYGSTVCESAEEGTVFDLLADPPGPEDEEEEDKREMFEFEFEFSDRPLLPCYNIQVSLSQGPKNWLLLSDVLRRLRLSPRAFRSTFPHMEVVTVAEAEFYRQASLSQLFSSPDELDAFQPDSKELLDLVEGSSELAARLGSSLECLDECWGQPRDKSKVNAKLGS